VPALHGRLLVESVLRPFAEHLAAMVQAHAGDTCVDASGDGGVLPMLLARAGATSIAADDDAAVLRDIADEAALLHLDSVRTVQTDDAHALPLPDGAAQVVTSLFAIAHAPDPAATLRELLRIRDRRRGRIAVATWSEPGAAPHEGALLDALHELNAQAPDALMRNLALGYPLAAEHLVEQAGGSGILEVVRIHDVVRFDGLAHYWAAMVTQRPLARDVDNADADLRRAVERTLQPYTAADGTMRIPTEAVVITTPAG
jgi:ubiquinone/menaquinone biosynthesis C-methylase UbiE